MLWGWALTSPALQGTFWIRISALRPCICFAEKELLKMALYRKERKFVSVAGKENLRNRNGNNQMDNFSSAKMMKRVCAS